MTGPIAPASVYNSMRSTVIASAALGIVIGIIALVWPGPTLRVIALVFGVALVLAGAFRISVALSARLLPPPTRWLLALLGALILIAGVIALLHPGDALVAIAIVIGIGWILSGVNDLMLGLNGMTMGPRWLSILSGVVSILAGIVVFMLPGQSVVVFITWGAILLIIVSIATLVSLPPKARFGDERAVL